ncbi:MAG: branched-chain amino acid ABC transporter permease, partial [Ramlibacter sp.]
LPGINMVIYGVVLIAIVMFLPRGIAGIGMPARRPRRPAKDGHG